MKILPMRWRQLLLRHPPTPMFKRAKRTDVVMTMAEPQMEVEVDTADMAVEAEADEEQQEDYDEDEDQEIAERRQVIVQEHFASH